LKRKNVQRGEWRVRQRKQKEQEDKRRDEKKNGKAKEIYFARLRRKAEK